MEEIQEAAVLLAMNAHRLVPKREDPEQYVHYWPKSIGSTWPVNLPNDVKNGIFVASVRMLLARDIRMVVAAHGQREHSHSPTYQRPSGHQVE